MCPPAYPPPLPRMSYSPPEPDYVSGAEEDEEEPQLGPGERQHPARTEESVELAPRHWPGAGQPRGRAGAPAGGCPLSPSTGPGRAGNASGGAVRAGPGWAGTSGRLERGAEAAPEKEEEEGRGCESICSDRETGARGDGQGGPGGGTPGCQAPFPAQSHGHEMGTGTLQ